MSAVAFIALAATQIASGLGVVRAKNLVYSVFWLAATLIATAGLYLVLHATFLAMVQLVLYTGGVITLMLFGVMLTQRESGTKVPNEAHRELPAALVAALLAGTMLTAIWSTPDLAERHAVANVATDSLLIGQGFLSEQLLAFELLSVLLLAAMIGAIVLARRTDP